MGSMEEGGEEDGWGETPNTMPWQWQKDTGIADIQLHETAHTAHRSSTAVVMQHPEYNPPPCTSVHFPAHCNPQNKAPHVWHHKAGVGFHLRLQQPCTGPPESKGSSNRPTGSAPQ